MNESKIFLAVPTHDNRAHMGFLIGVMRVHSMLMNNGMKTFMATAAKTSAARGRNNLFAEFLESDAERICFIDTDIHITAQGFAQLLNRNKDIIGGRYPHKTEELRWCVNYLKDELPVEDGPDKGLVKVKMIGTGSLQLSRRAVETIMAKHPEHFYIEDDPNGHGKRKYAFCQERPILDIGDTEWRWATDDWFLCHLARKSGLDIWLDTEVFFKHEGDCVYPLESRPHPV